MAMPFFQMEIFWIELIYSLIIIFSCLAIYFKTKEFYDLTSYKGIKYFRNAFLFFGIAFLSRLILRIFTISERTPIDFLFFNLGYLIFLYAGLMGGFYLVYSSIWKQFKHPEELGWLFHPAALTIAAIFIIFLFGPSALTILGVLFLLAAIFAYSYNKESAKKEGIKQLHVIYILLFIAWIANAAAQFFIRISIGTSILLYSVSSILFLVILYRVVKSIQR